MKKVLITLTILIPMIATCQITPINFNDCKVDDMFVSAESEPQWNNESISMVDYMNKHVNDKKIREVKEGKIIIGILIYPDGKTCCYSFINMTNTKLDADKFKETVNKMPNWTPAKQKGNEITFLKQQIYYIRNGKFTQN